jgi:hypothetical protein
MGRAGWRAVATLSFLATAWLWLVPYASDGPFVVNCGSALLSDRDGGGRAEAGCDASSQVRLQQGGITALFGGAVLAGLAIAASKDRELATRSVSHYR